MTATRPARSRLFAPAVVVGWALIAVGVIGMLGAGQQAEPVSVGRYVVGFALLHDAIVAPFVFVAAALVTRLVPPVARGPVRVGLAASAVLVVFTFPLVRRFGARPTNASALPLDYGPHLAFALAAMWILVLLVVAARLVADRRRRRPAISAPEGRGAPP